MLLRPLFAAALAPAALFLSFLLVASAAAQASVFDLEMNGRAVGRDTYTLAKTRQGFRLSSRFQTHANGMETDVSEDFKLDENYAFLEGGASNNASQMHTSFSPNKARTELVIGMVQAGAQESRHLAIKPSFVVLPAFDAGAAQVLLTVATTHPTADNLYNVVVPAGGSSGPPPAPGTAEEGMHQPTGGNFAYDALWTKGADSTGTLDGKPVTLHTYTLAAGKNTWMFFADSSNTLMQVSVSAPRVSYVRAKFKLDAGQ